MVDRAESKQARSSQRLRLKEDDDRISQLPDPLISHILTHLPIKEAVKTSVLSTRWKTLWLWLPCLELSHSNIPNFNVFMSLGDKFFDSNRVSWIHRVKLNIEYDGVDDTPYLKSWIDAAVKRKIQHLDVSCNPDTNYEIRLYKCETLVSLKLCDVQVTLDDTEFFSLPRLKTLHLKYIYYSNEAIFERLVSSCPVLEELKIFAYNWVSITVYRVISRTLKKLRIQHIDDNDEKNSFGVVNDAPRLSFLRIKDNYSYSYIIKNMDSIAEVDISLPFGLVDFDEASVSSRRRSIRSFLTGISKVRDMTISRDTFKLICLYSKSEPLPQFGYMSRLCVTLCVSDLKWLPTILEYCTNLKSLILVWKGNSKKMRQDDYFNPTNSFTSVPECLLSSLEFVDIRTSISGYAPEMKVLMYFLENSAVLKKLTLRFKMLWKIPRRSATCEVVVL